MKLNCTSLQHAVMPVEVERAGRARPLPPADAAPVAVVVLHGQLAPVAWAFAQAAPGARLGYVQTAGGALPGALSRRRARCCASAGCWPATSPRARRTAARATR